jgi:hypothetical protein
MVSGVLEFAIVGAAATSNVRTLFAVSGAESVRVMVTVTLPTTPVGIPETTPVSGLRVRPAGKVPAVTVQAPVEGMAADPGRADKEFTVASTPAITATVLGPTMPGAAETVIERGFDATMPALSFTVTKMRSNTPAAVGVPVILPVLLSITKPSGRPVADQVPAVVGIAAVPAAAVLAIFTGEPTRALASGETVVTAGAVAATEKLTVTGAAAPKLAPLDITASLFAASVQVPAPTIVTMLFASTVQTNGVLEVTTGLIANPTSEAGNSGKEPASGRLTPGEASSMV